MATQKDSSTPLKTPAAAKRAERLKRVRDAAEASLITFIAVVHPGRVLGSVHKEYLTWLTRPGHRSHQLGLIPRDHQKSALMAYRVAWILAKNPHYRVLYLSSTTNLAQKQLSFIKDILTLPVFRRYWPDHVHPMLSKRVKWSETEIALDHPKRKEEFIRDPSIYTAGLTTSITGMHFDVIVSDDAVVADNAYSREGRNKVSRQMSYLASILSAEGEIWAVGTRYQANDYYQTMKEMEYDTFDSKGYLLTREPLYEIFERRVENSPDATGTGEFLWPRQQREDGQWFGFDATVLSKKKAQYTNHAAFMSQYYNITSVSDGSGVVSTDAFNYYKPEYLKWDNGFLYFKGSRLNVTAAVDFAYTTTKRSDFTCIAVIGIDYDHNIYVLALDRFKTTKPSVMFSHIETLHVKWGFRKLHAEVVAAQLGTTEFLRSEVSRKGFAFTVEDKKVTATTGDKRTRITAILEPRYTNGNMWHYRGGNCDILESELTESNPRHDDAMDALAHAVELAKPPSRHNPFARVNRDLDAPYRHRVGGNSRFGSKTSTTGNITYHGDF